MMFKKLKSRPFSLLALISLSLVNSICAQDEPGITSSFQYQIYYLSGNNKALSKTELTAGKRYETKSPPELFSLIKGEASKLNLRQNEMSRTYTYNGTIPFILYKKVSLDDRVKFEPVASLPMGVNVPSKVVIVLLGNDEAGYEIVPLDVSMKGLRHGQVMIMNLSRQNLAARTRSRTIQILPTKSATIDMGELQNQRFQLSVAIQEEDQWKIIYNSQIARMGQVPLIALVYPSDAGRAGWKVKFIDSALFE